MFPMGTSVKARPGGFSARAIPMRASGQSERNNSSLKLKLSFALC